MYELLSAIIVLLALLIASVIDLKTRIVPDLLNLSLLIIALGLRAIYATSLGFNFFLEGLLGVAFAFLIAAFFYYTGQWGGGDAKLLMGLGAVIGVPLPLSLSSLNILGFVLLTLLLGAIYSLFYLIVLALREAKATREHINQTLRQNHVLHTVLIALAFSGLVVFIPSGWAILAPLTIAPLLFFYLILFVTTVEKTCFIKKRNIDQLVEGDWLHEEVTLKARTILPKKTLSAKDIDLLKEYQAKNQLETVTLKEGIPFVPSFLFGFLAYLLLTKLSFDLMVLLV